MSCTNSLRGIKVPVLLLGVLIATPGLYGQTSAISGVVTDPQGAVVPGADVTLTNEATSDQRVGLSDDEGRYNFVQVIPGLYTIRAELVGFRVQEVTAVPLPVDQSVVLDLRLELGQVSEVVTVESSAIELLNSVDASIGNTFQGDQIAQLPLNARNVFDLLSLQPGVTPGNTVEIDEKGEAAAGGSVAGARGDQSNLTLDGIDVNNQQDAAPFTPVLRVTPASVQEFRVTISNPTAAQGRSAGGQVSLITMGGTNDWHGSVYEAHRNTVTTANNFFSNRSGVERTNLIRNLFGASLGGPIKQDKAFFFFNYEGRTDRSQQSAVRVVPLAHLGEGIVRYTNAAGEMIEVGPDGFLQAFPDIGGQNPIAVATMRDAAAAYPSNDDSEGDTVNTGGFRFNASTPRDLNTWIAKLDFNLTDTQQLFVRGNYQWDNQGFLPWLPGQPSSTRWDHPIGGALGHTWSASPSITNTFRYGFTRQAFSEQGDSAENDISFRFVFQPRCFEKTDEGCRGRTLNRTTPVHNIVNDTSWITGDHIVQFGTNLRFIRNERDSFANSFDAAQMNPSFYAGSGGASENPIAAIFGETGPGQQDILRNSATALIGRYTEFQKRFLFDVDGSLLPAGVPASREFATEEYDFYVQDTWQVASGLTLNLGLRWGVNTPVNELNGLQVGTNLRLGDFFERRAASAFNGEPLNDLLTFDLAGPFHGRPGFYETDKNNFSPRISAAWSPSFEGGVMRKLFGGEGQTVIRSGFAMLYDRVGSQMAVSFDLNNVLGFSAANEISANTFDTSDNPGPLFTGFDQDIRSLPGVPIRESVEFPLTHPADELTRIESTLDNTLGTPVNYSWNFSIGRELKGGMFVELSYLGRSASDLLATRDLMHLNNLRDPASGQTWYEAARVIQEARFNNTPVNQVVPQPFFENLFPDFASAIPWTGIDPNVNSTQAAYLAIARSDVPCEPFDCSEFLFGEIGPDMTFLQAVMDDAGVIPNAFFHPQYGALAAWSTIASSDYHAFSVVVRQRLRDSLNFDINYTLSKSLDNTSGLQNSASYTQAFITNPLDPEGERARSDFDMRHIINSNWLWELPFGRGRTYGSGMSGVADAIAGGWGITGIFRWNSGLPQTAPSEASRWATNWNSGNRAIAIRDPKASPSKGNGDIPSFFPDRQFSYNSFRDAYAGEAGSRNIFDLQGFIQLDFGLHKSFAMPYAEGHRIEFRWEVFNATNTQKLGRPNDSRTGFGTTPDPHVGTPPPDWGNISEIQGAPRVMQFGLKYEF